MGRSRGRAGIGLLLLLLAACSRNESSDRARDVTARPGPLTSPTAEATAPVATPAAAGITAVPRTPAAAAAPAGDAAAAEAVLRRVTLFATDLPPGMTGQGPIAENNETAAARAPDPTAFRETAARWGRRGAVLTAFAEPMGASPSGRGRSVRSGAALFAGEEGARAQLDAFRSGGFPAVLSSGLAGAPGYPATGTPQALAAAPAVGDEALAWLLQPEGGGAPSVAVAFRRRAIVGVVIAAGSDLDAVALARQLDTRAAEAQRP